MKKSIFLFVCFVAAAMFFATGCSNRDTGAADSLLMGDSITTDTTTMDSITEVVEEEAMPVAADELFDDFFFNFAASRKVQRERINFPLPVNTYGKVTEIEKGNWRRETFFMEQGYYTLIFNNYKQLKLVKDTTVSEVTVERINVAKSSVTRWHFLRTRGLWHMVDKSVVSLKQHPDASFLSFYEQFASDADFQSEHLAESVTFTGPDPDDDFSTMTGEILPEQWPMFAPQLPSGTLYNIVYGTPSKKSDVRFFLIRGIANGLQTDLVFTRKGKSWQLKKCAM